MSEPVFEASVRIHADTSAVQQEATQGIKTSLDKAEQSAQVRTTSFEQRAQQRAQQQAALDARIAAERAQRDAQYQARRQQQEAELARMQPSVDLQMQSQIAATRASTAGLIGDEPQRRKFELEAVVKGTQAASLTMRRNSEDLAKEAARASGYQRELLLASAQNSVVAAEKLRLEAIRLQAEGLPADGAAGAAGGRRGLLGLLEGRSSGLAGIIGGAARFGVAGFAFATVFQGLGELQKRLETTGAAALTTEGRLRNVGSALLRGDLFQAVGALTREAKSVSDLGLNWQNAAAKGEALNKVAQGQASRLHEAATGADTYVAAGRGAAFVTDEVRQSMRDSYAAAGQYRDVVNQAGTANRELAAAGAEAARQLLAQKNAAIEAFTALVQLRDQAGLPIPFQGLGGLQSQAVTPAQFSQQQGVTPNTDLQGFGKQQNALQAAQRAGDLQAAARAADRLVQIAQGRVDTLIYNIRHRLTTVKDPDALLRQYRDQLQSALGVQDSINDQIAAQAKSAAEAAKSARDRAKAERERAAAERAADAATKAAAVQAGLENQIAKAALTKRKSDDIAAFNVAINYWRELGKAAKNATDREDAEAHVIALRKRLQDFLKGGPAAAGEDIRLLRIQNNIQAAQLTGRTSDDRRWADALIRYWQRQFKDAEGIDKERARTNLIAAKLARKQLDSSQDVEKATTTVFDLLSRTSDRFSQFAGNLRNANNPFSRESFVGEVAQYFKPGLTAADQLLAGPTGFTGSLAAFRDRNEKAGRIPGSGIQGSLDKNTAATDRLTDAILSGPIARNDKRYGLTVGEIAGARGQAMADFWKARQARQAAEAGVGAAGAGF